MNGKVAVVTGAAGGIGGAVAVALAGAGAEVVGIDREQADLSQRPTSPAPSPASSVSTCSSTRRDQRPALGDGPVEACTEEAWDAVLDTNLKSVFLCCKHAIPRLRAAGGGAIVTSRRCSASSAATRTSRLTRTPRARRGSSASRARSP